MKKILIFFLLFYSMSLFAQSREWIILRSQADTTAWLKVGAKVFSDSTMFFPDVLSGVSSVSASCPLVSSGGAHPNISLNLFAGSGMLIDTGSCSDTIVNNGVISLVAGPGISITTNGATDTITNIDTLVRSVASNNLYGGKVSGKNGVGNNSNTAYGEQTLNNITLGAVFGETAIGFEALHADQSGASNVAVGETSMLSLTTGSNNTAIGTGSAQGITTATDEVAVGSGALGSNTNGARNTASGQSSLSGVVGGADNTGIGNSAGNGITTGSGNTFLGSQTASSTNVSNSLAIGFQASVIGGNSGQIGNSTFDSLQTHAIIQPLGGVNLKGTSAPLETNYNPGKSGQFLESQGTGTTPVWDSLVTGVSSVTASAPLASSGGATPNISVVTTDPMTAGTFNSTFTGSSYKINGSVVLSDTGGVSNIFVGSSTAGSVITTGNENVCTGQSAFSSLTSGQQNTATGYHSLVGITTDNGNTADGYNALNSLQGGVNTRNTAVGAGSLSSDITGTNNVAVGYNSLTADASDAENSAVGGSSLANLTSGSSNVAVGQNAGGGQTTYNSCVLIGQGADINSNNLTNAIAIGQGALVVASNTIQLGNTSVVMTTTSGGITEGGKLILQTVTKAVNYAFDAVGTDFCVIESGNGTTVTLPATATLGRHCEVVFANTTAANTMTVSGNGHNINGAANVTLNAAIAVFTAQNSILVVGDGTNWWIVGSN